MADYVDPVNTATRLRAQRAEIERLRNQTRLLVSELRHCRETCQLQQIELADKDRLIAELRTQLAAVNSEQ